PPPVNSLLPIDAITSAPRRRASLAADSVPTCLHLTPYSLAAAPKNPHAVPLLIVRNLLSTANLAASGGNTTFPVSVLTTIAKHVGPHADVPIVCDLSPVIVYGLFAHRLSSWE